MAKEILKEFDNQFHTHDLKHHWPLDEEQREHYPSPFEIKQFIKEKFRKLENWEKEEMH